MESSQKTISISARITLALSLTILGLGFLATPWGKTWESFSYDILFLLRGELATPNDIVVVAIDESTFDEIDLQWPWPRSIHADLIESLSQSGARTIAFDLLFSEPSVIGEDEILAEAIEESGKVILASDINVVENKQFGFVQEKVVEPSPLLELMDKTNPVGYINLGLNSQGVRKLQAKKGAYISFSIQAARHFKREDLTKDITGGDLHINFVGPPRSIKTISYHEALDAEELLPTDYLKNKLVFVGFSTPSEASTESAMTDHFSVPFSRWGSGLMAGVEIHANAAHNYLTNSFITPLNRNFQFTLAAIIATIAGILFFSLRPLHSSILYVLLLSALVFATAVFFNQYKFFSPLLPVIPLSLCFVVSPFLHYWTTQRQKIFIRRAFATYLAPGLVAELIEHPERLGLGGEEKTGSVVFIDLAGFTSVSETLNPAELIGLINRHLGRFAEIILKHNGMIDKYIGDAIMAVWGIPIEEENHALNACLAALEISEALEELSQKEESITGVRFKLRIGISSGKMIAGNVGGGQQLNYTVLGNEVNLASRLEGINKAFETSIMISESTNAIVENEIETREIDTIRVVGQKKPVRIYEVLARKNGLSPEQDLANTNFQKAITLYRSRQFEEAKAVFEKTLSAAPEDGPAKALIERCKEYISNPPPEEWDGVHQMQSK